MSAINDALDMATAAVHRDLDARAQEVGASAVERRIALDLGNMLTLFLMEGAKQAAAHHGLKVDRGFRTRIGLLVGHYFDSSCRHSALLPGEGS